MAGFFDETEAENSSTCFASRKRRAGVRDFPGESVTEGSEEKSKTNGDLAALLETDEGIFRLLPIELRTLFLADRKRELFSLPVKTITSRASSFGVNHSSEDDEPCLGLLLVDLRSAEFEGCRSSSIALLDVLRPNDDFRPRTGGVLLLLLIASGASVAVGVPFSLFTELLRVGEPVEGLLKCTLRRETGFTTATCITASDNYIAYLHLQ